MKKYGIKAAAAMLYDRVFRPEFSHTGPYIERYYRHLSDAERRRELQTWYGEKNGTALHIDEPVRFSEKLQWLKLYDSTPLKSRLTDRFAARDYVRDRIGEEYLLPVYAIGLSFGAIDRAALPERCVLKTTSGGEDIPVTPEDPANRKQLKKHFDGMKRYRAKLDENQLLYEAQIPFRIFAEADPGKKTRGIEVWCFNGCARFAAEVSSNGKYFYTREGMPAGFGLSKASAANGQPEDPALLEKTARLAEKMADGFAFVSVSFCVYGGKVYFSEIDFTPGSGVAAFDPPETDETLGRLLELPADRYYADTSEV